MEDDINFDLKDIKPNKAHMDSIHSKLGKRISLQLPGSFQYSDRLLCDFTIYLNINTSFWMKYFQNSMRPGVLAQTSCFRDHRNYSM